MQNDNDGEDDGNAGGEWMTHLQKEFVMSAFTTSSRASSTPSSEATWTHSKQEIIEEECFCGE